MAFCSFLASIALIVSVVAADPFEPRLRSVDDPSLFASTKDDLRYGTHPLEKWPDGWQEPQCIWTSNYHSDGRDAEHCVYTNLKFGNGQGISIVTTPDDFESLLELPVFQEDLEQPAERATFKTYEIKQTAAKGRGIIASQPIKAGDVITQDFPFIMVDHGFADDNLDEPVLDHRTQLFDIVLQNLPESTRQAFQELHAWQKNGSHPFLGKFLINSYIIDDEGLYYTAVHANLSKLNHACRPNAGVYADFESLSHYVYALRDIPTGEEITMSYFDLPKMTTQERLEFTRDHLGFSCQCSLCSSIDADASDERAREIKSIENTLSDPDTIPAQPDGMIEYLLSLYQQEKLEAFIWRPYRFAAIEANSNGDVWRTKMWASKALHAARIGGAYALEYHDIWTLKTEPTQHWSWKRRVSDQDN